MATRAELFIWHRPEERWQLGIGLLGKPKTVRWLMNYQVSRQKGFKPSVVVGIGLQEVGVGNPGIFATLNWSTTFLLKVPSRAYLGVGRRMTARGKALDGGWAPLLGTSVLIVKDLTATVQMDGRKWHGVVALRTGDVRVGLFLFKFQHPGLIIGWSAP